MAIRNSQYDEIMAAYAQTQLRNRSIADERKQEIYEKIPRIAEIDQHIALSSIAAARSRLKGDTANPVSESNETLIAEKTDLLRTHGYPKDYLMPIYTCPLCQDTGQTEEGYCTCYKQACISFLYKESTLESILETENFSHFSLDYYPQEADSRHPYTPYENMKNILNKSKLFIENFDCLGGSLLFQGETGAGKTFLSNCIAKELLDTGHTVLYQSAIHLFEDVCADVVMNKHQIPGSNLVYRYLYDCDLLIIDDLGTEYNNSFVSSELYDILNMRMRAKKSTIISTNLDLKDLRERYSDRTVTRIMAEYKVFNFYGCNVRLAKRRETINN